MEAVGLAASIVTLVSATSFAGAALQKLQRLRGTQVHLVAAINEMNDFRATLSFVHSAVDGHEDLLPESSRSELEALLERSEEDLKNFTHYLETELLRDGKSDTTSPKLRSRAKFKELLGENQSRIDTFCRNFNSIKTALGVALGALSTLQVRTLAIPMTIQHVTFGPSCQDPSHVPQQLNTGDTTSVVEGMLSQQCRPEHGGAVSNGLANDSQSSNEIAVRKSFSHAATSNNYITIQTRLTPRGCRLGCLCQCHIPVENATPRWLRGVIGTAFFRYAGTPILNRRTCNVPKCSAREKRLGSLSFYYRFPSWLFSTAFEITTQWSDLQGIRSTWALRIPKNMNGFQVNRINDVLADKSISSSHRLLEYMISNGIRAIDTSQVTGIPIFEMALNAWNKNACMMLINKGCDISGINHAGITMAQLASRHYFDLPALFDDIWKLDEMQDAVDTLLLSTLHRIVIGLNDLDLVDHVEEYPEYIHQRDCFGFTPLHWATKMNNQLAVRILLEAGADVNALCKEGRSVLSWAAETGSRDICATLIRAGAEINLVDNEG
ncbi:ankyrin, partial [Corynespora cassiicola Philippines]